MLLRGNGLAGEERGEERRGEEKGWGGGGGGLWQLETVAIFFRAVHCVPAGHLLTIRPGFLGSLFPCVMAPAITGSGWSWNTQETG